MAELIGVDHLRRGRSLLWTAATIVFGDNFAMQHANVTSPLHITS
jgi:hypothetical protein